MSWLPLPTDPVLPSELMAEFLAVVQQGEETEVVSLPMLADLPLLTVARWLYRAWLEHQPRWRPLLHVDPRFLEETAEGKQAWQDALQQAGGGWMVLEKGWQRLGSRASLSQEARKFGIRLLLASEHPPLSAPASVVQRLRWLDRSHLVAVDPSLALIRSGLLAHCRAGGLVHISGARGTGRSALVTWAHGLLDDRPISWIMSEDEREPIPGEWQVYPEITQLPPARLRPLQEQLQPRVSVNSEHPPPRQGRNRPFHPAFQKIIGQSSSLCMVLEKIARYAPSNLSMLIRGPSGTGKELVAQAVHEASGRSGRYVAIDLSTQGENLIESALFGHVRGAFTGADRERQGAFREAHGGTLFLDELGNLSAAAQARLLRVLEQRMVQPLGSDRLHPVDVRVVAATNADLEAMVSRGEFRSDLLYRFNPSATLWLSPLCDRREDILLLARSFLQGSLLGRLPAEPWISPTAATALEDWPWPGNVRELRHVIEAAVVESGGRTIQPEHLGALAPQNRRSVPLLVLSSESLEGASHLPWTLRQHLLSQNIHLPLLVDRDPLSIRSAVLGSLQGRPIRSSALRMLEEYTWWGNFPELFAALKELLQAPEGVLGSHVMLRQLPNLVQGSNRAPIRALMFPTALQNGDIGGLTSIFHDGAVVIGRARGFSDIEPAPQESNLRIRRRWEHLQALLGAIPLGFLYVDHIRELSRAHLVVRRESGGLVVHGMPGTLLPGFAGPLTENKLYAIEPDKPIEIGSAGEIQVCSSQQIMLRLFLFSGEVAFAESAPALHARLSPTHATMATMIVKEMPIDSDTEDAPGRVWTLNAPERQALNQLLVQSVEQGGSLVQSLRQQARLLARREGLQRLGIYLNSSHPTQSCTRLYAHRTNQPLRQELQVLLQGQPGGPDIWERLPKGVRELLPPPSGG